jgi:hypothetical protein
MAVNVAVQRARARRDTRISGGDGLGSEVGLELAEASARG